MQDSIRQAKADQWLPLRARQAIPVLVRRPPTIGFLAEVVESRMLPRPRASRLAQALRMVVDHEERWAPHSTFLLGALN
jgi:hypothetical protein